MKSEANNNPTRPNKNVPKAPQKAVVPHPEWPDQEVYFEPFMAAEQLHRG